MILLSAAARSSPGRILGRRTVLGLLGMGARELAGGAAERSQPSSPREPKSSRRETRRIGNSCERSGYWLRTIVVFRSAKERSFAERKTTMARSSLRATKVFEDLLHGVGDMKGGAVMGAVVPDYFLLAGGFPE